ncbi:hypothetical protein [Pseudoalteromonas aurantia]|uniref:Adhesin domain-containing protein n=1 Tax=Pseudoalteromonas aurantia 208 TaxID=1314867 RepID=A0ABR9EJ35_9GAMM|nr:hypothetical protein [Pseudoalteromonas aurantia]MBE0369738.1 hypothetical protein [Pseudoalteromonas aurantia 208]
MKAILLLVLLAAINTASAADNHIIKQSFAIEDSQVLEIDVPAGNLEMIAYDGEQIEVSVVLKSQQHGNWYPHTNNLSDIKLKSQRNQNKLSLSIDEENLQQHWHVKVPTTFRLDIEIGVGNVDIADLSNSAEVEVGVGKVRIDTNVSDFNSVSLESAVGNTSLIGLVNKAQHHKKVIHSETIYHGKGAYNLEVEVGVGNIKVRH